MTVETTGQEVVPEAVAPIGAVPETPAAEPAQEQQQATPESGAPEGKPEEKGSPFQKRIDQLTWKAHEAERRFNAEMARRIELEQRLAQTETERLDAMRRQTMPRYEQYGDTDAFNKAVEEHSKAYIAEQNRIAKEADDRRQQAAAAQQIRSIIDSRIAEAEAKFPDFREKVNQPGLPDLAAESPPLFIALMQHPRMADLTYFLASNPSEAHRLVSVARTQPARALLELGEIGAKLPAAQTRAQSQAPAPPSTVGSGRGEVTKRLEDMSQDEFEAEWRRREKARKGR